MHTNSIKQLVVRTKVYLNTVHKQPNLHILLVIIGVLACAYLGNGIVDPHMMIFGGEYIFSFDYFTHILNIITEYKQYGLGIDNISCDNCPDFYHYSRWYSLFKIGYVGIGQLIYLHPFIFLIYSSIILQIISLYIFTRVFLKKYRFIPFITAAFFFIANPYKFSLYIETHDGTLYAATILLITIVHYSLTNLNKLTLKQTLVYALFTGLLLSSFFNLAIAFLPIITYALVILFITNLKRIRHNINKFIVYISPIGILVVLVNIPLFHSLLVFGNTKHYSGYISYSLRDSLLLGMDQAITNPFVVVIATLAIILSFGYSYLSKRHKLHLIFTYFLIGILLMGENSPINIYEIIFKNFPLMDSLRSTYRLYVFQMIIVYVFMYTALINSSHYKRIISLTIYFLIVIVPLLHIYDNKNYFYYGVLPPEYFEAQQYLNKIDEKKLYFPLNQQGIQNISNRFYWSMPNYNQTIVIYKNPFTSVIPVKNILQFEKYPLLSKDLLEIRSGFGADTPLEDTINLLARQNIKYIIYDNNYKWETSAENIPLDKLLALTHLKKRFGSIYILEVPKVNTKCDRYYGDLNPNECLDVMDPEILRNRSHVSYILDRYRKDIAKIQFELDRKMEYYNNILDPVVQESILDNRILYSENVLQIPANQKSVFTAKLSRKGVYTLYIPIIELKSADPTGNAYLTIKLNNKKVANILQSRKCSTVVLHTLNIKNRDDSASISIDVNGNGYILLNESPFILGVESNDRVIKLSKLLQIPEMWTCEL
jgi:hypothetical protein